MSKLKTYKLIFWTGFIQVFLVGVNTWQIAHEKWLGVAIIGFGISFIWTWNVRKIVFGDTRDRIVYSIGASIGGVLGAVLTKYFYQLNF